MDRRTHLLNWIRAQLINLVILAAVVLIGAVSASYVRGQGNKVELFAEDSHKFNCAYLIYNETRYEDTETILRENPGPFPAADLGLPKLPRSVLVNSQRTLRQLLDALPPLDC